MFENNYTDYTEWQRREAPRDYPEITGGIRVDNGQEDKLSLG